MLGQRSPARHPLADPLLLMSVVPFPGDALLDAPGDGLLLSASGEAVAPRLHDVGTAAGIWQAAAQAAQPPAGISFGAAVSASASVLRPDEQALAMPDAIYAERPQPFVRQAVELVDSDAGEGFDVRSGSICLLY